MPPRYLLGMNTASYIIKGSVPRVRERLMKVPMSQVLISAVTEAELLFGAARKREAVRLKMNFYCEWILCRGIPTRQGVTLICEPPLRWVGSPWGIWI
jgi:hypothetical protein